MGVVRLANECQPPSPKRVAVGTALAGGPPHGSGRAALLHPALALGNNAMAQQKMRMITPHSFPADCLTYSLKRAGQDLPALSPEPVTFKRFPLGQSPFLHCLRSPSGGFVRQLRRSYETVRLRASLDFPMRFPFSQTDTGSLGFRSRCLRACSGSQTAQGP